MDHQQRKVHSSSASSSVRTLVRSSSKVISITNQDINNNISTSSSRATTIMTNNNSSSKNKKSINRSKSLIIIKGSPRNQQEECDDDNDLYTKTKTKRSKTATSIKRNNNHHTKKSVSAFDDFESLIVQSTIADIERMNKNRLCKMILIVCMCLLITIIGQLTSVNTYTIIFGNSDNNDNQKEEEKDRLKSAGTATKMISTMSSQRNTNHEAPNIHPNNKKNMKNGMTIPTSTAGVILHLGRTGGTLIAQQLLLNNNINVSSTSTSTSNNINPPKKNNQSSNATTLSQLTTYYHHSEFDALSLVDDDDNNDINKRSASTWKTNNLRSNTNKKPILVPLSYHQRRPPKNVDIGMKNSNILPSTNISSSKYKFVILTLRDPFDRTVSSYAWMHPSNPNYTIPNTTITSKTKVSTDENMQHSSSISSAQVQERHDTFYNVCFPDLNAFAAALTAVDDDDNVNSGNNKKRDNDIENNDTPSKHCRDLARSVLNNEVQELEYFFWDTKHVWNHFLDDTENITTPSTDIQNSNTSLTKNSSSSASTKSTKKLIDANADVYVIRLESMNEDWQKIHIMLGLVSSSSQTVQTDTAKTNETSDSTISLQSELSSLSSLFNDVVVVHDSNNEHIIDPSLVTIYNKKNHEQLCNALFSEYVAYLSLLKRATNIQQSQQEQSLLLAQQRCPNLNLQY